MMNISASQDWYLLRKEALTQDLNTLNRKRKQLGILRLVSILSAFALLWYTWTFAVFILLPLVFALFAAFLYLVTADLRNNEKIKNTTTLLAIIEDELKVLAHDFTHLPDGEQFKPVNHDYAHDLDIFGKSSIYQYCNRTTSEQGSRLLADWLLAPADKNTIMLRQQAVKDMATQAAWRQQLQAYGLQDSIRLNTEKKINNWLQQQNRFITKGVWQVLRWLLPIAAMSILMLHIAGIIGAPAFYTMVFIFFTFSLYTSKLVMPEYRQLNKIAAEIETLSHSIQHIEGATFHAELLLSLKKQFEQSNTKASVSVRQLKSILDRLDYRLNPLVFLPLNTFLSWDLQQVFALEKWKNRNKPGMTHWFESLATIEALSSLGNLHFNQPSWTFPTIASTHAVFDGKDIGHPLIPPSKRVCSSFATSGKGKISLVTGSNMAGKSTFLRCVGVNYILAMAGAPVCATSLEVSVAKVMSSMRVSDNLEESTSTFYAELKKLKQILDAVKREEKVLLLLDEILRGTNSADRHTGSSALIRQLIHLGAVGLVATHDLELAGLEAQFPEAISNYHFDVQVNGEELYFDYIFKEGVCTSMNASLLMKKIGIEL